jgi:hypothetical protein
VTNVESLAAALLGLPPADRAKLLALILDQGEDSGDGAS